MKKILLMFILTVLFCINNQTDFNLGIMLGGKTICQVKAFSTYCIEFEPGEYILDAVPINDNTVAPVRARYIFDDNYNYTWNLGVEQKK